MKRTSIKQIIKAVLPQNGFNYLRKIYWKLKKYARRGLRFATVGVLYPAVYYFYSQSPVKKDKVIFAEVRMAAMSDSLILLHHAMEQKGFEIHDHFLRSGFSKRLQYIKNCLLYVKDIADARYIFINDSINILGRLKLRKETKMVQTWHGCGAFKKFGYSTSDLLFGAGRKEIDRYPTSNNYSFVTVSSPEVVWAYQEAMGISKDRILPLGVSRTDVFFDTRFLKEARERVKEKFPEISGKKVILYAPTFRGRVANAKAPGQLSIPMFYEAFSKEYVLLIKHHPFVKQRPAIPEQYRSFAVDVSGQIDIEALLIISDLCITDYSSLIFEYSLFERPMIFFAYDREDYCDWRGFYYDYDELTPGPVCRTNEEMIEYIKNLSERFDSRQLVKFREKFMGACDGGATGRILEYLFILDEGEGNV